MPIGDSNIVTSTSTASTMVMPFGNYSNLGVQYEGESASELAEKAGLNWNIKLASMIYQVGEENYPSKADRVICREDNPEVNFGTCGNRWQPLQNIDVLEAIIEFCSQAPGTKLQRIGSFKKGETVWAIATTDKEFVLEGGDKVTNNLLLANHHCFGKGFEVNDLFWRQVCSNGMTHQVKIGRQVYAHTQSLTQSKVAGILQESFNCFNKFKEDSELMANTTLDINAVYSFVISNFGNKDKMVWNKPSVSDLSEQPKAVKQILSLYLGAGQGSDLLSSSNTSWGLMNAITEHQQYGSIQRGGMEGHINSLWLESKARKQQNVYKQLVSLSGV